MRILVTGSEGGIGRRLVPHLREAGWEVRTTDQAPASAGDPAVHTVADLRDLEVVAGLLEGMDAVAHLGAIADDWPGHDQEVFQINVNGTWNILTGCARHGVKRAVCFSSIQALGNVCGHRETLYLPIADNYPRHPVSTYQLSKHLGEEMCRSFTDRHGLTTVSLRPVGVSHPERYERWRERARDDSRPTAVSNYWAYVDVRDVCDAVLRALQFEDGHHDAFILAADDTVSATPTAELVGRYYPHIPWRGVSMEEYLAGSPHRTLVDCSHAKSVLGWQSRHSWRREDRE